MNRAERRRQEKESRKNKLNDKELQNWIRTLTKDKVELINKYSEMTCKNKFDDMVQALDRCFSAAMIENTSFSLEEINNIFKRAFELVAEDTEKVKNLNNENGGNWIMAVNKSESKVKEAAKKYFEQGLTKKEAIKCLEMDFPKLSKSMITNAYQRVVEEMKEEKSKRDPDINKAVEYIFQGENSATKNKEVTAKQLEKWDEQYNSGGKLAAEVKEIERAEEDKEEAKEMQAKGEVANNATTESKLKVLEEKVIKTIKVEGENGVYEGKTGEGLVLTKDNATVRFNTAEELEEWTKEFKEVFGMLKA